MDRDRATRLLPIVLAVIIGLVGMHALVVVDGGHRMEPMSTTVSTAAAAPDAAGVPAPPGRHDGPSSEHRMLHLCLAVLVALLVLLTGLRSAGVAASTDDATGSNPGRPRPAPPRRPPPTSVRLAQLCVMRN